MVPIMESAAAEAPAITDNPDASRYEMHVGGELAGVILYRLQDETISLLHTEIEEAFQGAHLAGHLARYALDDARERGLAVLPFCPYVGSWIKKHPEYSDLVPQDRRPSFGL
jgi:uncharacterized protein